MLNSCPATGVASQPVSSGASVHMYIQSRQVLGLSCGVTFPESPGIQGTSIWASWCRPGKFSLTPPSPPLFEGISTVLPRGGGRYHLHGVQPRRLLGYDATQYDGAFQCSGTLVPCIRSHESAGHTVVVPRATILGGRDHLPPQPTIACQSRRQVPYIVMDLSSCAS